MDTFFDLLSEGVPPKPSPQPRCAGREILRTGTFLSDIELADAAPTPLPGGWAASPLGEGDWQNASCLMGWAVFPSFPL